VTAGAAPVHVFVAARGNGFMTDIAGWIAEAARLSGRAADVITDGLPADDGSINLVVAPHEFFELHHATKAELQRAAAASICVCTEQPGTPWFHLSVDACRRGLLSLDINPHGVDALRAVGVSVERLPLGAVPSMSAPSAPRPIDVLFLGGLDDRRSQVIAALAPRLYRRRSELRLFRFDRPATATTPGMAFGADKYALLASSRVLLNVHRDRSMHLPSGATPPAYFEWARMVETMANGCVVVSEPSEGFEPLEPGRHFVEAEAGQLAAALDALLDDEPRRAAVAAAAHEAVTGPLAFATAVGRALDGIERDVLPRLGAHVASGRWAKGLWRIGQLSAPPPVRLGAFRPYLPILRRAKSAAMAENHLQRGIDATRCLLAHGTTDHEQRTTTSTWATATPEVSVIVSLYNYADVVTETLDSIVASQDVEIEVVVVDDHATDDSRARVREFMDAHDDVPMLLVGKDANGGLAKARNTGFRSARAELVMVMDADNLVYPTCLRRLADELHSHPEVDAAYAVLEDFGEQQSIRSALAWDPIRLCQANYIDAQSMIRRATWERLGGYRDDDDHVFGWEDWDLWLRLAGSGGSARLVPQVLGRYRVQRGSMIGLTNLATDEAIAAVRARYPDLPWPAAS
jgi:hypothetical protein